MKIKVSVPATSANIGSGFDALGLAVTLYNTVTFEDSEVLDISQAVVHLGTMLQGVHHIGHNGTGGGQLAGTPQDGARGFGL